MNILLITNDWLPKKGGISTYLTKLSENLNSNLIIYAPNWADGELSLIHISEPTRPY